MTTLYVIRHAQAEGNLYRRFHGHYDSPVTELGLRQIAALRERFLDIQVDAVYSSDLVRTQSTARAIAEPRGLTLQTTDRLREVYAGPWEDKLWGEIEKEQPDQFRYYMTDPALWDIGTNEKHLDLERRALTALQEIAACHDGETVAVVTHGDFIRTFQARLLNIPSNRFSQLTYCDNTAVSVLEAAGGGLSILDINDAGHLTPELRLPASRRLEAKGKKDMYFLPMDLEGDRERYLQYRREAWKTVHGTMAGYTDEYLKIAQRYGREHPLAVSEAWLGDEPAGLLELAVNRGREAGDGAIAFFYLAPQFRGRGFAVQLIGQAVSVYRSLGRRRLTLNVAEENTRAIGFYRRFGFKDAGFTGGALGRLLVMEKDIGVRVL